MEIPERNRTWAHRTLNVNGCVQRRQGYAHIGWICGDAVLTRAQNGKRAIVAGDSRAAATGLALVARHSGVAEVDAACSLQEVSADGRHVADLRRSALQDGLRQNGIVLLHLVMIRQ